ncbi:hypothetical protein KJ781_01490, partial [Patescibacteria group bacterium]|nr:hypothetical protein [Patescibacteria group bacterium]
DISNPNELRLLSSTAVTAGTTVDEVQVSGNYLYVLALSTGLHSYLQIFDISNPEVLVSKSASIIDNYTAKGLHVIGSAAYIAMENVVSVYDVSSPTSLDYYVGNTMTNLVGATDIYMQGRYGYAVGSGGNMVSMNASTTFKVAYEDDLAVGANITAIAVQGPYAYTANYGAGSISAVQIGDAEDINEAWEVKTQGNPVDLEVSGRYLYVAVERDDADTTLVNMYDVATSTNAKPTFVGSGCQGKDTETKPTAIKVSGNLIYVADDTSGKIYVCRIPGAEVASLTAHSAEVGSLNVRTNVSIQNDLSLQGALAVGSRSRFDEIVSIRSYASSTSPTLDVSNDYCGLAGEDRGVRIAGFGVGGDYRVSIRCNGSVYADFSYVTAGGDYAEYFRTQDTTLTAGDVVAMTDVTASSVKRAMHGDREYVLGVISDNPAVVGNGNGEDGSRDTDPNWKIVGLMGQIPVKASEAMGRIKAGDKLMAGDDGYAVKAVGVGMVLGQAMDPLTTPTGTITVYVKPDWSGDGILSALADGSASIDPRGQATATTSTYASYGLAFTGSAWNAASSTAITSSFTLGNDVVSSTASFFTLKNTLGTKVLTISDLGDMDVRGDLYVGKRLFLGSKSLGAGSTSTYIFVDDTQAPSSTYIATNADGWSTSSTYDYAERYVSDDALVPGDLVMTDQTGTNKVKRTTGIQDTVLGIVSTKPGFITGAYSTGTHPIALAGRVPTRISTQNGPIVAGDLLAPSSEPGVAVKAVESGPTVGVALESYDAPTEGKISVFVRAGWKGGDVVTTSGTIGYETNLAPGISPRSGLAKIAAGSTEVNVSFATLNSYPLITVAPYGQATNGWWLMNVNDHGFTIILGEAPTFDLIFSWKAEPSPADATMSLSDGTSVPYDPTSGNPVAPPEIPPPPE